MSVKLIEIAFPEAEIDPIVPQIPRETYQGRLDSVRQAMDQRGLDFLIVYADREHFANLTFMTGYDPRFEEALLVISKDGKPHLLVGNEGAGYAGIAKLDVEVVLHQTFSLMGQPRDKSKPLPELMRDLGIRPGTKVGLTGTKYFLEGEVADPKHSFDVPSFITDSIRSVAGFENVTNESAIFVHPETGLRTSLTVDDIAVFEYAAEIVYSGVRRTLTALKPGISEVEAAAQLGYTGEFPLSCHITLGFGGNACLGLSSPTAWNRLKIGDYVNFGLGIWGANIARAGLAVSDGSELPAGAGGFVEDFCIPYFEMILEWYRALKIGSTAGEVYSKVSRFVEDPKSGVSLNPGHLIHLDEWSNSPFSKGSKAVLHSGMAIQCDIIFAPGPPYYGMHVEDGLVLADSSLREELAKKYPKTMMRIRRRRAFMIDQLGFELPEEVLPMSSIQGALSPYMLRPTLVMSKA